MVEGGGREWSSPDSATHASGIPNLNTNDRISLIDDVSNVPVRREKWVGVRLGGGSQGNLGLDD